MIAGKSSTDQAPARLFAYRERALFQRLIELLVQASVDYLSWQIEAGVDAVQIFDTWAAVLPSSEFERWCLEPVAALVAKLRLRYKDARIIGFPKGIEHKLMFLVAETTARMAGGDALDQAVYAVTEEVAAEMQGEWLREAPTAKR